MTCILRIVFNLVCAYICVTCGKSAPKPDFESDHDKDLNQKEQLKKNEKKAVEEEEAQVEKSAVKEESSEHLPHNNKKVKISHDVDEL
ncbi:hypothetical protein M8J76_000978 [Diaphorina citri]|nr:hypothetical protein M8J76_000978 [Diaphorina citri]